MVRVNIPPATGIWSSTMADPGEAIKQIPDNDRWRGFKVDLQQNFERLKQLRRSFSKDPGEPLADNEDALYQRVKADYLFVSGADLIAQAAFDKKVEMQYLKYQMEGDSGGGQFSKWYYEETQKSVDNRVLELVISIISLMLVLEHDHAIKTQVASYQQWVLGVHGYWSKYLDGQIDEQATLLENMDSLLSTQRRLGVFTHSDMTALNRWQLWTTRVFALLAIVLVAALLALNADRLLPMVRKLQATVGGEGAK